VGFSVKFNKKSTTVQEQIELLAKRGLIISNSTEAAHYLQFISYYRLSGYFFHFQKKDGTDTENNFLPNQTFEKILNIYIFDRELRLLVMDAIERIEVGFRTGVINVMSQKYGPHWPCDPKHFVKFNHTDFINKIEAITREYAEAKRRGRPKGELFIDHYAVKYNDPKHPPCWMLAEVLSLQTWSVIFTKIKYRDAQKAIAAPFGISNEALESWMHCITYVRNLCAHHSRLWRRIYTIKPLVAYNYKEQLKDNRKFYAQAVIMFVLLRKIAPKTEWHKRLRDLIKRHPDVLLEEIGFPTNWENDSFWKFDQI
jgi:abortive infection bacteriophage resistance protein